MAGSVALRHTYAGIETLYQRMGELRTGSHPAAEADDNDDKSLAPKEWKSDVVWARGNFSNYDVDVNKGWDFDSNTNGFLIGIDPSRPVGQEGVVHLGVFGGFNSTDSTVDGSSFGRRTPSKVDIDGWTVGGYATFFNRLTPGQGFYADLVGKVDGLNLDMSNSTVTPRPAPTPPLIPARPRSAMASSSAAAGRSSRAGRSPSSRSIRATTPSVPMVSTFTPKMPTRRSAGLVFNSRTRCIARAAPPIRPT